MQFQVSSSKFQAVSGPIVILLSGSINAGKSTVAGVLVRLLPRAAHVEVDALYDFIRPLPLDEAIPINLENAALVARNMVRHCFSVVLTYPLGVDDHAFLFGALADCGAPIHTFTLSPALEAVTTNRGDRELSAREVARIQEQYADGRHRPPFGLCIDNTYQTPVETAQLILQLLDERLQENDPASSGPQTGA